VGKMGDYIGFKPQQAIPIAHVIVFAILVAKIHVYRRAYYTIAYSPKKTPYAIA
jgi:hypothetical protein